MCHTLIQLCSMNNSKVDAKETELALIGEMLLLHRVGACSVHESRGLIASISARPRETGAIPHFHHPALRTSSSINQLRLCCPSLVLPMPCYPPLSTSREVASALGCESLQCKLRAPRAS